MDQTAANIQRSTEDRGGVGCCGFGRRRQVQEMGVVRTEVEDNRNRRISPEQVREKVKALKQRFEGLVENYSNFEEDVYRIPESELVDLLGGLAIDTYGVLLYVRCMVELETRNLSILWLLLRFLSHRMPTQISMTMLKHYSSVFARFNPEDVDAIGRSLVAGSQFPLATCLVLSAFFKERSKKDLTQEKQLLDLAQKYAERSRQILESIENDYLAVILLEVPSFHGGKTPLEISFENDIVEFLSCNKVSRIAHAVWTTNEALRIGDTDAFTLKGVSFLDVRTLIVDDAYGFYFSPVGYFCVELILFVMYLLLFTYLTHERFDIYQRVKPIEYVFWVCSLGYIMNEVTEIVDIGWIAYFTRWQNFLDSLLSFNFAVIIVLRLVNRFGDFTQDREKNLNTAYMIIWATNVVLLWIRLSHFLLRSSTEGPLVNTLINMLSDIYSFAKMWLIFTMGFACGLFFLVGGSNGNVMFRTLPGTIASLFKVTLGQFEWECIEDVGKNDAKEGEGSCECEYGCDVKTEEIRLDLVEFSLVLYTLASLIILFNLLTAMMATTYATLSDQSGKEVLSRKVFLAYDYNNTSNVMPPPLNAVVWALYAMYNAVDVVLLLISQKFLNETFSSQWRCQKCHGLNDFRDKSDTCKLCLQPHIGILPKRRILRRPRKKKIPGEEDDDEDGGYWSNVQLGLRELFTRSEDDSEVINYADWVCGYCRSRVPSGLLADIYAFKKRLENHAVQVDEDDVEAIAKLNPKMCPVCFRQLNVRDRSFLILEFISYYVFLFLLYPALRIVTMPAYINKVITYFKSRQNASSKAEGFAPKTVAEIMPPGDVHIQLLKSRHAVWQTLSSWQKRGARQERDRDPDVKYDDTCQQAEKQESAGAAAEEMRRAKLLSEITDEIQELIDQHYKGRVARAGNT